MVALVFLLSQVASACGPVTPQAQANYESCMATRSTANVKSSFIVDADRKLAWLTTGSGAPKCFGITIGSESVRTGRLIGKAGFTPPGLHFTKKHDGDVWDSSNSLGLYGVAPENANSTDEGPRARGVLIHPANNPTEGCIGIKDKRMGEVLKGLGPNSAPVYIYSKTTKGTACGQTATPAAPTTAPATGAPGATS